MSKGKEILSVDLGTTIPVYESKDVTVSALVDGGVDLYNNAVSPRLSSVGVEV